ncbi:thiosulfate/3-mercaptopyruvate sulfurtransferase [Lewinella marina]|uniref:Sulfurtransferase n=1 Tax=Neolewinella marina TaxID=438751 RepID=A0A2G0CCZ6_9BACT|nr:sulfurtransferase [Neolewinella marina]NJB86953.1 thiosulfate/3-mercaptopyruvate sulfurtransferase [Neolewinella marina]PHK97851.1 sulfurtransferase [Neolewinella marina]
MTTPLISAAELAALLPENPLILDCRFDLADPERGRQDYLENHILGARYLHLNDDLSGPVVAGRTGRHPLPDRHLFARLMGRLGLTPSRPVVVYDDKGGGIAARAWWLLKDLGHDAVAVLDGGYAAWLEMGGRTAHGPEPEDESAEPYPLAPVPRLGTCGRAQTEALRQDESYTLIDSRTPERYRGEVEPIDPVAGHIPGAINLPWPENLDGDGKFKSREALRERFAHLQKEPQQNVFYCGSGVTACHNILAYYYAFGELPALYPGSWSEYLLLLAE